VAPVGTIRDEAVCIRHWDWSETSQTVSLFTREHGVLRGLAKGSKREKTDFSGGLEILTRGEVLALTKPTRALATLTAWELRETFPQCRSDLVRHYAGVYAIDLVHHAILEGDPHPNLYDDLVSCLRGLGEPESAADPAVQTLRFQWSVLTEIGQAPQLTQDSQTGKPLARVDVFGFNPQTGGVTADPGPGIASVWRVRAETIELLGSLGGAQGIAPSQSPAVLRANSLLAAYLRERLEVEPHSMQPLLDCLDR
jgi:DNA repair protein RecO (recombination protein O)